MQAVKSVNEAIVDNMQLTNPRFGDWFERESRRNDPQSVSPPALEVRAMLEAGAGLDYLHSYFSTASAGSNICGQAAIATVLDYYGLDAYGLPRDRQDPRDGRLHWDNDAIIRKIASQFPPDVLWGLMGSSKELIVQALRNFGFRAQAGYSGVGSLGWGDQWEAMKRWVAAQLPVIALLDTGAIGGDFGQAHWVVVYRIDGNDVTVANWVRLPVIPVDQFLHAWHCQFLPLGSNHCGVYPQR